MGTVDRVIRVLLAVAVAIAYFSNLITGVLGVVLLVVGAIFLLAAFVSFCPLYAPFGIKTCKTK